MNKKILALSVVAALASSAASAKVTVYEEDGYKFDVKGDIEVNYKKATGVDTEAKINIDDADFAFLVESQVNDDLKLFGEASFDGDSTEGKVKETTDDGTTITYKDVGEEKGVFLDNLYVGLTFGKITAKAGRFANYVDTIGVSTDYEVGGIYEAWDGTGLKDKTEQTFQVEYRDDMFYAGFDIAQDNDGYKQDAKDFEQFSARVGVKFGAAEVTGFFADSSDLDAETLALQGKLKVMENITLGAIYSTGEKGDVKQEAFGVSAKYTMADWSYSAGWSELEVDSKADLSRWYANVGYNISKNAMLFAEVDSNNGKDVDMGYAAGMRLFF